LLLLLVGMKSIHDTPRIIAVLGAGHISTTRNGKLQFLTGDGLKGKCW
jgi:hypothetical protein